MFFLCFGKTDKCLKISMNCQNNWTSSIHRNHQKMFPISSVKIFIGNSITGGCNLWSHILMTWDQKIHEKLKMKFKKSAKSHLKNGANRENHGWSILQFV